MKPGPICGLKVGGKLKGTILTAPSYSRLPTPLRASGQNSTVRKVDELQADKNPKFNETNTCRRLTSSEMNENEQKGYVFLL